MTCHTIWPNGIPYYKYMMTHVTAFRNGPYVKNMYEVAPFRHGFPSQLPGESGPAMAWRDWSCNDLTEGIYGMAVNLRQLREGLHIVIMTWAN